MADDPLVELSDRIERTVASAGDDPAVFDDDAGQLALRLARAQPDSLDAAYALGAFHWVRYQLRAEEPDRQTALYWFARVFTGHPQVVPEELGAVLAGRLPLGEGPDAWYEQALAALGGSADTAPDEALERGHDLLSAAFGGVMPDDPRHAVYADGLCWLLAERAQRGGDADDLERSIRLGRIAVAEVAPGDPDQAGFLTSLGQALGVRFARGGDGDDAEQALAALTEAVARTAGPGPQRALRLRGISVIRIRRHATLTRPGDLDAAIAVAEQALVEAGDHRRVRAEVLNTLGAALRVRYERDLAEADLVRAVELLRAAVDLTQPSSAAHLRSLGNLASALHDGFAYLGSVAALDEAIRLTRLAATQIDPGNSHRAVLLGNLCAFLTTRFEHLHASTDIERAISAGAEAISASPAGDPRRPGYLSNMGIALRRRYEATDDPADLDAAVDVQRETLAALPDDHPMRSSYRVNLANTLRVRSTLGEHAGDVDEAVELARRAAGGTSTPKPGRARFLTSLSAALRERFDRRGEPSDATAAIAAAGEALGLTPPDQSAWAARSRLLGLAWHASFDRTGLSAERDQALMAYRSAVDTPVALPSDRVTAARLYASLSERAGLWQEAAWGWDIVLSALPELTQHRFSQVDRQRQLVPLQGVGSHAAAAALWLGRPGRALEVLEQGRGVLVGQHLDLTHGLASLRREHPELAREAVGLRALLSADVSADTSAAIPRGVNVTERFQDLLARIRSEPGFERFGLPTSESELRQVAGEYPIIALTVAGDRGDALIVTGDHVSALRLPGLTRWAATLAGNIVLTSTQAPTGDTFARYPVPPSWSRPDDEPAPADLDRSEAAHLAAVGAWRLRVALTWLWRTVIGPVLDHLGYREAPQPGQSWPRLVWLPTGPLSLLPLHAAGDLVGADPRSPVVLDRVVSSYASSIRALRLASRQYVAGGERRALVVGIDEAPGQPPLSHAVTEAQTVAGLLGTSGLIDGEATRGEVAARLMMTTWAHFSCHADADAKDPSRSLIALHDGPLTVADLVDLGATEARLAFLSACTSAFGGAQLFDESIHIASALQTAGFAHVVGTLWPIPDLPAVRVAKVFYRAMLDRDDPPYALHTALRSAWARYGPAVAGAYVHFGPVGPERGLVS